MTQQDRNLNWLIFGFFCALATAAIAVLLFGGGSIGMRGVLAISLATCLYNAVKIYRRLRSSGP